MAICIQYVQSGISSSLINTRDDDKNDVDYNDVNDRANNENGTVFIQIVDKKSDSSGGGFQLEIKLQRCERAEGSQVLAVSPLVS